MVNLSTLKWLVEERESKDEARLEVFNPAYGRYFAVVNLDVKEDGTIVFITATEPTNV